MFDQSDVFVIALCYVGVAEEVLCYSHEASSYSE